MNVISLFDGMSCGYMALERAGFKVNNYFASEVDKHAIAESTANFPDIARIGDVRGVKLHNLKDVDLLIGGSPCQSFSFSGKLAGMTTTCNEKILTLDRYLELKEQGFEFKGQSYLFWEFVRCLEELRTHNPNIKFLLENVVMKKEWEEIITKTLGVEPIKIDSRLVSAQIRKRLYWTNIEGVTQPEDRNIHLEDILEDIDYPFPAAIRGRRLNNGTIVGRRLNDGKRDDYNKDIPISQCLEVRKVSTTKSNCLTTVSKDNVLTPLEPGRYPDAFKDELPFRYYTLTELCRLQTIPDDYFKVSSLNQAKKMIGNGWNVDTIAHIFSFLKKENRMIDDWLDKYGDPKIEAQVKKEAEWIKKNGRS
jgi:DNA (cytosine-5)-methyltransferase 3A